MLYRIRNKKINRTQMNEHGPIAKYASNHNAHNSFRKVLFEANKLHIK